MLSHKIHALSDAAGDAESAPAGQREAVLVVEPDDLMRWSIRTYLGRWFDVGTAPAFDATDAMGERMFAALLLSGEVPAREAEAIRQLVRRRNSDAKIVWMVTGTPETPAADGHTVYVEKPFALTRLARVLGVSEVELAAGYNAARS